MRSIGNAVKDCQTFTISAIDFFFLNKFWFTEVGTTGKNYCKKGMNKMWWGFILSALLEMSADGKKADSLCLIHHEPKICSGGYLSTMPQPFHDCGRHWFGFLHK